jgi:DNA-binding MarR family transcriptional regulator
MTRDRTLEQARHIFTVGKMIQNRIFRAQREHFQAHGKESAFGELSVAQLHAIMVVRLQEQLSMSELSSLLTVSPAAASAMVERLVEKGVLARRVDSRDRRRVVVQLSSAGKREMEGIERAMLRAVVDLVHKVGPETTRKWCQVLEKVDAVLRRETEAFRKP